MTELSGGTGYTTGGSSITWNTASAAATSNSNTVSWTNSGTSWSLVGLEIWDTAGSPLRHLWGTWAGQPVTVANGNTFQVAAAGISVSLVLYQPVPCFIVSYPIDLASANIISLSDLRIASYFENERVSVNSPSLIVLFAPSFAFGWAMTIFRGVTFCHAPDCIIKFREK